MCIRDSLDPIRVEGGWLTAHDHRSDDTRTFAVHRITTVQAVGAGDVHGAVRDLGAAST